MNTQYAGRLPEGSERYTRFFAALGDATRLQILLVFEPHEEVCVNEIARLFKLSRPAISHHLKVLRSAGLLECEKRGKEVYYRVNYPYCVEVLRHVLEFATQAASASGRSSPPPVEAIRRPAAG